MANSFWGRMKVDPTAYDKIWINRRLWKLIPSSSRGFVRAHLRYLRGWSSESFTANAGRLQIAVL